MKFSLHTSFPGKKNLGSILGFLPAHSVVGLDIGSRTVKAVEVHRGKSGLRVGNLAIVELPVRSGRSRQSADDTRAAILTVKNKFKSRTVSAVLPSHNIMERAISLPRMPHSEIPQALTWEVRKYASFSPEDMTLDYLVLGESKAAESGQLMVYVVAASLTDVIRHVDFIKSLGLVPVALETKATALCQAYQTGGLLPTDRTAAIIDMGATSTAIAIVKKGMLYFTREIPWGGDRFTEAIAAARSIDWEQAEQSKKSGDFTEVEISGEAANLLNEIQRSFDYFMAQYLEEKVDITFITGGSSQLKGLAEHLRTGLDIELSNKEPYQHAAWPPLTGGQNIGSVIGSALSLALGLSDR